LVRAQAGFKGQVGYAQLAGGAQLNISGDAELQDFLANAGAAPLDARLPDTASKAALVTVPEVVAAGEELLRWKSLSLRGLNIALAPSQASQISVGETVLSDFFARLILSPAGRLNLQDVVKSPATAPSNDKQTQAGPAPVISFGPISLTRGQVHFSDRFIQPNYSANLTELTGSLGAFSSQTQATPTKLAEVSLRGRAQSTASLEISGQINPLLSPPVLDIKGRVRDLELPPLSMYSVHYAGYGIERGKLSVDVSYQVQADGQLVANNKLVLNQLSFGNKVEGAPGNLPVKLAVALLADSNGVIDIELPVSGSLNDPQFRLGPIVFKLIVNLIGKAITSPFTLLAGALGGGSDELSQVTFTPGSAALTEQARAGLSKVAKALTQRPALRMTVVGTASLENEREAYQRERLKALVRAQKGSSPESAAVSEAEYPALLKAVYKKADFVKPRNLLGVVKDIPVEEMQALLLANLPAGEDAMRELALQRGLAVRDYLATQNLTTDRLFLGQPKTVSSEEKWSPRAQLSLGLP
jgi:outer membrane protein OmpA-like peptidoglycan-associated protein